MDWQMFVAESNRIEGILRPPLATEVAATESFINREIPTVDCLEALAETYAGVRAQLRDREGMDVRVGSYFPPRGGPHIRARLQQLLKRIETADPYEFHLEYEALHPFIGWDAASAN